MRNLLLLALSSSFLSECVLASAFPSRFVQRDVLGRRDAPSAPAASSPSPTREVGKLRYKENSGECETTPNVYQASGYGEIAQNQSMFFWFFEARENPDKAPLTLWLNGGPGSTSFYGLLQEIGPCRITQDGQSYSYNKYSWNNVSNMLYIDQPIGTGFSYGTTNVTNTYEAAAALWDFLQIFFTDTKFTKLVGRDFNLWTESYGGHYGPAFSAYFLKQNAKIQSGEIKGTVIPLKSLGIVNGLTDAITQYPGYVTYAASNPYQPLVDETIIQTVNASMTTRGGCLDQFAECQKRGNGYEDARVICAQAQALCYLTVLFPLVGERDFYDVRLFAGNATYPPDMTPLLTNETFMDLIGAESPMVVSNLDVNNNFSFGGDYAISFAPELEQIIEAGIRTVILAGDADYIANYHGVENMVAHLNTSLTSPFSSAEFSNYTVNGNPAGLVKNLGGTFSYLRVFGAGHEVPAYNYTGLETGQAALQFFSQALRGEELTST